MYAKLKFNSGTSTALAIRDIVRLITESAAGNASLSNLGSISTSDSELSAGVNSGWTLYAGQSIPANSASASSSSDSFYTLQATSATNSRTKYCAIYGNCHFSSGSGMTYTNSSQAGILLGSVDDVTLSNANTAYNFSLGYNSTSTSYMNDMGFLSAYFGGTIYIWADPTRIIMYGDRDNNSRPLLMANLEGNQGPLDVWKTKCPTMTIYDSTYNISTSGGHEANGRGESYFANNYGKRFVQFHNVTAAGSDFPLGQTFSVVSYTSDGYGYNLATHTPRGRNTGAPHTETNTTKLAYFASGGYDNQYYNTFTNIWQDRQSTYKKQGLATHTAFNSSGATALQVEPFSIKFMGHPTAYDFSSITNTWIAPSNIGTNLEAVTIGSDVYNYINFSTTAYTSYLIKKN